MNQERILLISFSTVCLLLLFNQPDSWCAEQHYFYFFRSLILAPRTENERKPRNNYYQMQYKHLDRWGNCAAFYSIKKAIEVGWTFVLLIDTVSILCRLVAINCAYGNTNKSADICLFYCRLKFFLLLYLHRWIFCI